jgi:uncharacterized membrane protein YoaK (UPF0700 family)
VQFTAAVFIRREEGQRLIFKVLCLLLASSLLLALLLLCLHSVPSVPPEEIKFILRLLLALMLKDQALPL